MTFIREGDGGGGENLAATLALGSAMGANPIVADNVASIIRGSDAATGTAAAIRGGDSSGAGIDGADLTLDGGDGNGTGTTGGGTVSVKGGDGGTTGGDVILKGGIAPAGNSTPGGVVDIVGGYKVSGIANPPQLTGTHNNYDPLGLPETAMLRLSCDSGNRFLTGLVAQQAWRRVVIINVAGGLAFSITLTHEDGASLAANRFALPGNASLVIPHEGSVELAYDPFNLRWRVVA